jgi:hypothetical protein
VSDRWFTGEWSGLSFPADPAALRDGDIAFLTKVFHASYLVDTGNAVVRMVD